MSTQDLSTALGPRWFAIRFGIVFLATIGFIALFMGARGLAVVGGMIAHSRVHAPNWSLIAEAPLAIRIHLATVVAALALATVQMVGPKGRTFHRWLGWTLAILLVTTAIAAMFIRNPLGGLFNPFQVFVVWTLIAVPWGVLAARGHNVRRHARLMTGMYFGGLIVAGLLTFLPGRLMWRVFFG
jgi:uncharacterized membrane protein